MSGNDFDNVPQRIQIPATEKPGFFAVRRGTQRVTSAGLDGRTDALCGRLAVAGIEKAALAGILLDGSLSTITSFLGVLKAGGAFVPLDPSGQSDQRITRRTRFGQETDAAGRARPQVYRKMNIPKYGRCARPEGYSADAREYY
jgi:acyl-CoA synthetase (AMP-forming)/AMP-acid ligase II